MVLRDGGTTCITYELDGEKQNLTIDYALPRDGRPRYVTLSKDPFGKGKAVRLRINSPQEKRLLAAIREAAMEHMGADVVEGYLKDPESNPAEGVWFHVLNFLRISALER